MSYLLPHFLKGGRGTLDVYFTRVYNPLWTNPDGFSWMEVLQDTDRIRMHVSLSPTWSETAWFADYILPMGLGTERHDTMSQETHAGQWLGFRQPGLRVAREKRGERQTSPHTAKPGEGEGGSSGRGSRGGVQHAVTQGGVFFAGARRVGLAGARDPPLRPGARVLAGLEARGRRVRPPAELPAADADSHAVRREMAL